MKPRFAIALPTTDAACLGTLRRWNGVEVCESQPRVWLRAAHLEEAEWERCRSLPGAERYTVLDDGQLVPVGALVPRGRLPEGRWLPLADWMRVELPRAGLAAGVPKRAPLTLVRSTEPRDAAWLLTTLEAWCAYAAVAPQVRLARWSFAADRAGSVLVRGTPLPPLPGRRFVEIDGIAVPAGWKWSPEVPAAVMREVLMLEKGECALWTSDGAWRRIAADAWVRATRSAVRMTSAEIAS